MRVILVSAVLKKLDAIGHDVLGQYQCMKDQGIDVHIYAEGYEPDTAEYISGDCLRFTDDPDTIIIYHHAGYWKEADNLLRRARCRKIVRYHNITPEHFFAPYSSTYFRLCLIGMWQNREIMRSGIDMLLPASRFNARDFTGIGFPEDRCRVLPPFHVIHEFASMDSDPELGQRLSDGKTNVLFVGRVSPNKGHVHLMNTVLYYRMLFDDNIRLVIAGHVSPHLTKYYAHLLRMARSLGISKNVEFWGKVTTRQLASLYRESDAYLLLSEHEGFCVPILEAQSQGLPVIAYDSSAIGETIGPNQLIYDQLNYELLASAVYTLRNEKTARDYLIREGYTNFMRFSHAEITGQFVSLLEEIEGTLR